MGNSKDSLKLPALWSSPPRTLTAKQDIEEVLASVIHLPLPYWKERMFFVGMPDEQTYQLTQGRFPASLGPGTHPVFSLKPLPDHVGFSVCPCSSKRPFRERMFRYIKKGCSLSYTGQALDRTSYLIENLCFNIPKSIASTLRFLGQVPEECIGHDWNP